MKYLCCKISDSLIIIEKSEFVTSTPDQKKESSSDYQIANSNPECDIEGEFIKLMMLTKPCNKIQWNNY